MSSEHNEVCSHRGGSATEELQYFSYSQTQATKEEREWKLNIQIISLPALSSPASVSYWLSPIRIQKGSSPQGLSAFWGTKQGREENRLHRGPTEEP